MTFLEFINKKNIAEAEEQMFFEDFREKDISQVNELMLKIFKAKISGGKVILMSPQPFNIISDGKKMISYRFALINENGGGFKSIWGINYLKTKNSNTPYSIDFFDKKASIQVIWSQFGEYKSTLTIYTMGSSVAYFIPVICKVISSNDFKITDKEIEKEANNIFGGNLHKGVGDYRESKLWIGSACYRIFENLSTSIIENAFRIANDCLLEDQSDTEILKQVKKNRKPALDKAWNNRHNSKEDKELWKKLDKEYKEILATIKGGGNIKDLSFSIASEIPTMDDTPGIKETQKELDKRKNDPKHAFKRMSIYVKSVIKGQQPGTILCGAPGIGKTYRVKQQLKAAGYHEGHNLYTIKGTETPRQLYIDMYENKEKGKIIVIDDADALVGPKAPEVAINILKAALDSTSDDEGRLVTYKITGDIKDEEGTPIPKQMYFNAGIIVITNYSIGQLDTALRGRVFTQSLDFTTEQVLELIKELLPGIGKGNLSENSKNKAYDYLVKLNEQGKDMEISIRTFASAARLYELSENENMTEEEVNEMIEEQMENQSLRGGKKY